MSKRIPLEGKTYGKLKVERYIGNGKYQCRCECGKACTVFGTNLVQHHTTSCGCAKYADLTGKVFGDLKVIGRAGTKKRGSTKRTVWQCECLRCGAVTQVYGDSLLSGSTTSCGCIAREKDIPEKMRAEFIAGTQISKLGSKPTKANKSGVVGVNWDKTRGKWMASIRFKGHRYNLGRFSDFEEACKARKKAEKELFGDFLSNNKEIINVQSYCTNDKKDV